MPTNTGLKLSTLSYVILYVKDTEKASQFYCDKLGLKIKLNQPGWVELETGSTTLALHQADAVSGKPAEHSPYMVFAVQDIHEAYNTLKQDGIVFTGEPKQVCEEGDKIGLSADFTDLDGNHLSIFGLVAQKN